MEFKFKKITTILVSALLLVSTATATTGEKQLTAKFNNIKIVLNGEELIPKDAKGNIVEPFIIDGTTYLPVRAIGEALDLEVKWDSPTQSVILTEPTQTAVYVTPTGKRYHYSPTCNGGTYYESTLEEAIERGLTPCDKCVLKEG